MTQFTFGQSASDLKQVYESLAVFEDALALKLKKDVKPKQLKSIGNTDLRKLAEEISNGRYISDYKLATYKAKLSPMTLGQQLAIGEGYSRFENITGIYLSLGKHIILADGIKEDKEVRLLVANWMRTPPDAQKPTEDPKGWGLERSEFLLRNGVNIIELDKFDGLAYIDYFSDTPDEENAV